MSSVYVLVGEDGNPWVYRDMCVADSALAADDYFRHRGWGSRKGNIYEQSEMRVREVLQDGFGPLDFRQKKLDEERAELRRKIEQLDQLLFEHPEVRGKYTEQEEFERKVMENSDKMNDIANFISPDDRGHPRPINTIVAEFSVDPSFWEGEDK